MANQYTENEQLPTINRVVVDGDIYDLIGNSKSAAIIERHFAKHTHRDKAISSLAIPSSPIWLNIIVRLIRYYRKRIGHRLGNRCVLDPSCSHYAELAFREKGFIKGFKLTLKRLHRCRPDNGGVDELP